MSETESVGRTMADVQAHLKRNHPNPGDGHTLDRPAQRPSLGRIVHYRGKFGIQAMRAAVVTADTDSLDVSASRAGAVPTLTDEYHVHLWVFTPAAAGPNAATGGFPEFDVPYGDGPGEWHWPPRV